MEHKGIGARLLHGQGHGNLLAEVQAHVSRSLVGYAVRERAVSVGNLMPMGHGIIGQGVEFEDELLRGLGGGFVGSWLVGGRLIRGFRGIDLIQVHIIQNEGRVGGHVHRTEGQYVITCI